MSAVITGSSTGIGRAIAIAMSRAGAKVILHGRSESVELKDTAARIEQTGGNVKTITCDLTRGAADLEAFVDACWDALQRIDVWVNNAGADILTSANAALSFADKLDLLYAVDIRGTAMLSRCIGQRMVESGGKHGGQSILNMAWDQALYGMAGDSGMLFGAAKGAVIALTKSLAQTYAPSVRVNCLAPGWIKTEWGMSSSAYWQQRACAESLMNRWGTPDDVASLAVYLASPRASFVSGQVIPVNGGFRLAVSAGDSCR